MDLLRFTTESYSEAERLRAWVKALDTMGWRSGAIASVRALRGTIVAQRSPGGFDLGLLASVAQTLEPNAACGDGVLIVLHLDGVATLQANSGRQPLAVNDLVFLPSGEGASLLFATDFRAFVARVPRSAIRGRLFASSMNAGRIAGDVGVGHVFSGFLASLAEGVETMSANDLRPLELALVEFLVAILSVQQRETPLSGLTSSQAAIFSRVCRSIDAQLGDPNISLARLATEERVSQRYLQKLFESAGQSFSTYLRLSRLERCRAELVDPLHEKTSISDICFRWGFNDPAHFSRAFREQYKTSPRAFRHEASLDLARHVVQRISRGLPLNTDALLVPAKASSREATLDAAGAIVASRPVDTRTGSRQAISSRSGKPRHHLLRATANTVHWGYFSHDLKPVLEVDSGDSVTIETLTQHASDDWARMVAGDPGAESVFHWTAERKNVNRRGAGPIDASIYGRGAGEGFGVHICTGPIAVRGAEPGDILEVRILEVHPRRCANPQFSGRAFGSNAAAWWGFHYRELLTEPKPREVVTIYELDAEPRPDQGTPFARAVYNYRWTPQCDPFGVVHPTIDYPGVPVDHSTVEENYGILKGVKIPVRPHFGLIAVAPQQDGLIDSIPPSAFGGNLDNWRVAQGASVYLPVGVPGALLSVGDPHASQGDSELCGTAIECSLTGEFQLILHKRATLTGQPYADLTYPLVETADEWVLHGFSHANYLAEFGTHAQSKVYEKSTLDLAMRDAFIKTRRFLMTTKGLTEDEAISLMSVAVDFGVTQVVDGNWGVHAIIRKALFTE
ncbi:MULTISPECIES: acetamidase/formamidase family protein [unclassified Paraburkholderia]|uniref:acetamidase/formamidase family protein n=1 Tax=unclassified Paraburkholderia TaxID=2615204 RepID=UPI00160C6704|nr:MULTISPECIES: acetamidase/formamidase family protein [unclassified Paraburkholderia]MBB5443692.1 acetamidase/formamidase/AraC-like DNA-binding protein [Paraburkholderia sp. WSM4177]MBB5485181.1 acetamidase/formamidase/AraC-like DNA-binding protein [Paraburkholderia sp. WSM4180]